MGQGQMVITMEGAINDFSREKSDLMSTKQPTSPDITDLQRKHDIKNKREGIWCLLLIFKVAYWDYLTQLLPFAWDFIAKGQQLVRG